MDDRCGSRRVPSTNSGRLASSARIRRGPQRGCDRRISQTSASTSAGTCHGEDFGRLDRSASASSPPDS
jgi:hypothetical protein